MTRNEMVAQILGIEYICDDAFDIKGEMISLHSIEFAKLLQQRMVDDGWTIQIAHGRGWGPDQNCSFELNATALPSKEENEKLKSALGDGFLHCRRSWGDSEPAAIFDLFCKVYGIATQPVGE